MSRAVLDPVPPYYNERLVNIKEALIDLTRSVRSRTHQPDASYLVMEAELEEADWKAASALLREQAKKHPNKTRLKRLEEEANRASDAYMKFRREETQSIREFGDRFIKG